MVNKSQSNQGLSPSKGGDIIAKSDNVESSIIVNIVADLNAQNIGALRNNLHQLFDAANGQSLTDSNPVANLSDEQITLLAAMVAKHGGADVSLESNTTDVEGFNTLDASIAGQLDLSGAHTPDLGTITATIATFIDSRKTDEAHQHLKNDHIKAEIAAQASKNDAQTSPSKGGGNNTHQVMDKIEAHADMKNDQATQPHKVEGSNVKDIQATKAMGVAQEHVRGTMP